MTLYTTKKCIVAGCCNMTNEGTFIGDLCKPCHAAITSKEVNFGEASRFVKRIPWLSDHLSSINVTPEIESGDYVISDGEKFYVYEGMTITSNVIFAIYRKVKCIWRKLALS